LINVSTSEACQSIKKAATNNGNEDMMRLLIGIKDDLIAAEAKYHKNCYVLYISKKSPHVQLETQTSDIGYDNAFQRLTEDLKHGLDEGRAFDMASLLARYKEFLLESRKLQHAMSKASLEEFLWRGNCFPPTVRKSKARINLLIQR